jgi:hypothetical protein
VSVLHLAKAFVCGHVVWTHWSHTIAVCTAAGEACDVTVLLMCKSNQQIRVPLTATPFRGM